MVAYRERLCFGGVKGGKENPTRSLFLMIEVPVYEMWGENRGGVEA